MSSASSCCSITRLSVLFFLALSAVIARKRNLMLVFESTCSILAAAAALVCLPRRETKSSNFSRSC
ncbi:hypothetical protein BDV95DRAFT_567753 [Massariosphaeria phaeospora]|uniref:Uncharacterized protein n=1 Tax=Massariosphaeria phaeospora TaxID=100035 RepID=A0A7C8IGP6_9PLEO|nr:hypothetical protein BDV95DRAFT_567753 [Massariosphaeria phaeospora]